MWGQYNGAANAASYYQSFWAGDIDPGTEITASGVLYSHEADWIGQGTKVINELRLDFSREEDQKSYEDNMIEFLSIPADVVAKDRAVSN